MRQEKSEQSSIYLIDKIWKEMDRNVFNLLLLIVLIALTMNVERSQGLATILLPLPDTSVSGRSLRQRTVMKMNTKKHKQLPRDIPLKYSRLYQYIKHQLAEKKSKNYPLYDVARSLDETQWKGIHEIWKRNMENKIFNKCHAQKFELINI